MVRRRRHGAASSRSRSCRCGIPQLAADEVRRCAAKGSYAIAFTENPSKLGFPSLYTGEWDVLWDACQETDTTVSMHIGSSSSMPTTSPDAPLATTMALSSQNAEGSLCDWVFSRHARRASPTLKIAYAESQVGWMPYLLERMDIVWRERRRRRRSSTEAPSEIVQGRVWGCVFDDQHGLNMPRRGRPRARSCSRPTTPTPTARGPSRGRSPTACARAPAWTRRSAVAFLRGNAIDCYGLERFGIIA